MNRFRRVAYVAAITLLLITRLSAQELCYEVSESDEFQYFNMPGRGSQSIQISKSIYSPNQGDVQIFQVNNSSHNSSLLEVKIFDSISDESNANMNDFSSLYDFVLKINTTTAEKGFVHQQTSTGDFEEMGFRALGDLRVATGSNCFDLSNSICSSESACKQVGPTIIGELGFDFTENKKNKPFNTQHSVDSEYSEALGTVAGPGNSTEMNDYTSIDANPHAGLIFDRLLQMDYDGRHSVSSIIDLEQTSITGKVLVACPNPARDFLKSTRASVDREAVEMNIQNNMLS
jgi:hypothetical protein